MRNMFINAGKSDKKLPYYSTRTRLDSIIHLADHIHLGKPYSVLHDCCVWSGASAAAEGKKEIVSGGHCWNRSARGVHAVR